ncbi:RNA-guided endonuclease IscB [Microseira sp. BLCC-F43]|jgi:5-methylcytosine-specific restriction endonuclease McrA|uniref:RNA-guided endonuclease IscB n=1 Tax=Microseira sp. BLCC-F43 TaxID=3153602 RepID=UPI0035BA25A8
MSKVLVIDTNKRQLEPVHPAAARLLLSYGKAAVFRHYPFTIILKEARTNLAVQPLRLKLDHGAKTTGIAIINENDGKVVFAAQLQHRGFAIRDALISRHQLRRGRRARKTRYRKPRFLNRRRHSGWLPPSLESRVANILTWVHKFRKYCKIAAISQELVKFDTQLIENPDINGVEYQQGTIAGYELREYLLEKWNRQCAYCGIKDVPLQVEHIHPKSKGGSNRVSNLCLACESCNVKKGNRLIQEFLKGKQGLLNKILSQAKRPLADTAAVNATRWELFRRLKETGWPVECGTGGRTKFNRTNLRLPKTHWIDAACVGASTPKLKVDGVKPMLIKATGHGTRQMCGTDKYGFPIRHRSRTQIHQGFQTGDIVKAVVTKGKKVGGYFGRVSCRATGCFDISTKDGRVQGISHKYCQVIHRKDGYTYCF